ncbi:MAG: lysophospholipid acyltransferase family protein [Chloroflexota bacterium]
MSFLNTAAEHLWVGFKYYFYRGTSWVASKVPVRFSYAVASLVGDFVYLTWKRHSANAVSNMRRVLGPTASWQTVKRLSRNSFRNYCKTMVDFLRFPYLDANDITKAVPIRYGIEHLQEANRKGSGTLIISGHFGNWDIAGAIMLSYGLPLNAVSESYEPKKIDDLVNGTREKAGIKIIRLETHSLRQIFTALKKNEAVTILFDRPEPTTEGVPVQFFGETAYVPAGPAAIAIKTKASILVGYCVRMPGNKTFYGAVEPPIEFESLLTGNKEADIQIVTQQYVSRMEQVIRRHPDQWYMFREMWPRTEEHDAEIRQKRFWGGQKTANEGLVNG